MEFKGRVLKYGDNIDTDVIIPARYLNTTNPEELAKHCMEDLDKEFINKVSKGDILVVGENFGCGSSREHAPIAIKATGISCIIAKSFAHIFYRNSINIGLPIFECKEIFQETDEGDILEVDANSGTIINLSSNKRYYFKPFPDFIKKIIESGGLINWTKEKIKYRRYDGF